MNAVLLKPTSVQVLEHCFVISGDTHIMLTIN